MHIAIDARELLGKPTGAGRYLAGMLEAWSQSPRRVAHTFQLYASHPPTRRFGQLPGAPLVLPGRGGSWWEQVTLARAIGRDRPDVLFAPAYSAPIAIRTPTVLAIHDASFFAHPEWFTSREGLRRRLLTRAAARRASTVVTISEFSRGELLKYLDVSASRIRVVPPGVTPLVQPAATRDPGSPPRVLYVGSIFNRRHVPDLILAFAPIAHAHADARLDIVGETRTSPFQDLHALVEHEGLGAQVQLCDYVSDAQLGELFRCASVFAFLSEYEGLGLTPLEALAAGLPSVVLDTSIAREAYGPSACFVSQGDLGACTAALDALLFDEAARRRVLDRAPETLARYDWARAADDTLDLLEHAARLNK